MRPQDVWQRGYFWELLLICGCTAGSAHIAMNCFYALDVRLAARDGLGAEALHALLPDLRGRGGRADRDRPLTCLTRSALPVCSLMIGTLGASGAIYGVILAYSLTRPSARSC